MYASFLPRVDSGRDLIIEFGLLVILDADHPMMRLINVNKEHECIFLQFLPKVDSGQYVIMNLDCL